MTGGTLAEGFAGAEVLDHDVIAPLDTPLAGQGGIAVLRGSLAPDGALIKRAAASPGPSWANGNWPLPIFRRPLHSPQR